MSTTVSELIVLAKAIALLTKRLDELERALKDLDMRHGNLFQDYLHYKVNHP